MNIRTQLITNNRPRTPMEPQYVTMHNTGNADSTAQNNRDYFANHPEKEVSAQWVVDDKEAILCVPENEVAWHAGTLGNRQSIGIEVCEFTDPARHEQSYQNAVKLVADILKRHGWGVDRVTTHKRWTGKQCPWRILPIWPKFLSDVGNALRQPKVIVNGRPVSIPAKLVNGRTYVLLDGETGASWVQIRALAALLNATLTWDEPTLTAKLTI